MPTHGPTQLLTPNAQVDVPPSEGSVESRLFLPAQALRAGEGGLRTKGLYKTSTAEKPLLTVITAVYNGVDVLEDTILSVLTQSYENVEYIVIDGGSRDGTVDVIKKHEDSIDYWISEPDVNHFDAMNKGITLSTGRWLNFMNAGDHFYNTGSLEHLFQHCTDDASVVYGGCKFIALTHSYYFVPVKITLLTLLKHVTFNHQAMLFNRTCIFHYDPSYTISADFHLILHIYLARNKHHFVRTAEVVALCQLDGIGTQNMIGSFLDRTRAFWAVAPAFSLLLMAYLPFFYIKSKLLSLLKNHPLLVIYRRFKYGRRA